MKILLNSGGVDSSAIAHWHRPDLNVTIDYGQPAFEGEARAAVSICAHFGLSHEVIQLPLYNEGPSGNGYWPFRNQLLISVIAAKFGHHHSLTIQIGVLRDDIYSDCDLQFIAQMDEVLRRQHNGIRLEAPASKLDCTQLLKQSRFPPECLGATFSCHRASLPCGDCRGCQKSAWVYAMLDQ